MENNGEQQILMLSINDIQHVAQPCQTHAPACRVGVMTVTAIDTDDPPDCAEDETSIGGAISEGCHPFRNVEKR